ncbi:MAG TPA: hypothetical protein G4N95_07975 [Anaerolineae bacterium]|nr:hypothetical protein [Anaerolineae bacterium]
MVIIQRMAGSQGRRLRIFLGGGRHGGKGRRAGDEEDERRTTEDGVRNAR